MQTPLVYDYTLSSSISSPSACPTPSTSFSSRSTSQLASPTRTLPHLFSLPLFCLPLHLNTAVLLSQQTSIGFLHNNPSLAFTSLHLPLLASILALCGDIHINHCPPASFLSPSISTISALVSLTITYLP